MTLPFTLPAGNGSKTVYAQFKDIGGSASPIVSDTIGLDTTLPTSPTSRSTSSPIRSRPRSTSSSPGAVAPTRWQRVRRLRPSPEVDGGAWAILSYPTATSANVAIDTSKNYVFGIASRDAAGNVGTNVVGPTIRAGNYTETSTQIKYASTWGTHSLTTYLGGAAKYSTTKSASATFTFTGNQVAWLSRKSSSHGSANVYIDGAFVTSVNLYSATTQIKQVVFTRTFPTVGTHTLKIVVVGTAGHSRVTVDSFFVLR